VTAKGAIQQHDLVHRDWPPSRSRVVEADDRFARPAPVDRTIALYTGAVTPAPQPDERKATKGRAQLHGRARGHSYAAKWFVQYRSPAGWSGPVAGTRVVPWSQGPVANGRSGAGSWPPRAASKLIRLVLPLLVGGVAAFERSPVSCVAGAVACDSVTVNEQKTA
jgi:hypothetical protein